MADESPDLEEIPGEDAKQKDERFRQKFEGFVPDLLKRTFYAGVGAIFTSEESLRRIANEFSLPKDVASYLVTQAQGTKDELFRIVATEVRGFLESLNLSDELQRLLTSLSFEIKTEVRFIPNAQKVKPSIKHSVSVRRRGEDRPEAAPDQPVNDE
ncbi:MAG: hypothetical protein JRH20_15985 [Deltaproteobacteria bacterium]|nr:hypothetical protein [Deltaproteobacteria bacterium]